MNELKNGQECWAWTTKNPDPRIICREWLLLNEFNVYEDIFLSKTTFDGQECHKYYATAEDAINAMLRRIENIINHEIPFGRLSYSDNNT